MTEEGGMSTLNGNAVCWCFCIIIARCGVDSDADSESSRTRKKTPEVHLKILETSFFFFKCDFCSDKINAKRRYLTSHASFYILAMYMSL